MKIIICDKTTDEINAIWRPSVSPPFQVTEGTYQILEPVENPINAETGEEYTDAELIELFKGSADGIILK